MGPLRWGICGAGKIANDFVVALRTLPAAEHEVTAVAARSMESSKGFAKTHSVKKAFDKYEDLANDPEVDVVYVSTIHPSHLPNTLAMLEKAKPVLCEKPLTMNARDTAVLIKFARDKGMFLMEAMWTRFFPAVVELRKQIEQGAIGQVKCVKASFCMKSTAQRLTDPKLGGGAVLDVGVYVVSFATMIFGEKPESVHASGWLRKDTGVDEFAAFVLKYSGERVAQLSCSSGLKCANEAVVYGTEGELKLPEPFWCPTVLETPNGIQEFPLPKPSLPLNYHNSEGMRFEAEEIKQCLLDGKRESLIMPLDQTQWIAEIMDEVMKQLGVKR